MNKKDLKKLSGYLLITLGLFIFISNIKISGRGFFIFNTFNISGFILLLIIINFVLLFLKYRKLWVITLIGLFVILLFSVLLRIRVFLETISIFEFLIIAILISSGTAIIIKQKRANN